MKRATTLFVLSLVSTLANAQFAEKNAIYLTLEVNAGNYLGMGRNLNYIFDTRYSFIIGLSGYIRNPQSQPDNYSQGLFYTQSSPRPFDQLGSAYILVGRVYKLNKNEKNRANLSIGIGYTSVTEPTNWELIEDRVRFTPSHTYEYQTFSRISLILNPKIEFPFTRVYGLYISPLLQINKDRTYIGIGVGHMIGLLRKKIEKPDNNSLP